jgi:large subunit ribosomal protein L18
MSVITKRNQWKNKKSRISYKINKSLKFPKIIIFRSNRNIFIQVIDNESNSTICSSSSLDRDLSKDISKSKNKVDMSKIVAENISKKIKSKKIDRVVFDRSGYRFHGRVKIIADTLKENGISI